MGWKHFPDSPWGNIDICDHGCIREHDSIKRVCVYCDYPPKADINLAHCDTCKSITWHLDGKCMRCKNVKSVDV